MENGASPRCLTPDDCHQWAVGMMVWWATAFPWESGFLAAVGKEKSQAARMSTCHALRSILCTGCQGAVYIINFTFSSINYTCIF